MTYYGQCKLHTLFYLRSLFMIYLVECATHLIVDALFRPYRPNELYGAFALLRSIQPGMLV